MSGKASMQPEVRVERVGAITRCPRCGGAVVAAHGEASCMACGHEVVAVVRAWETAPSPTAVDVTNGGRKYQRRKYPNGHEVPWTEEERRAWREWKTGDPVPDVGYEEKEEPMDQGEMADKIRVANMPGRFDIATLRTQVQGRIDVLAGLIQRERERSAERIAESSEELGQLRKTLVALGGVKPEVPRSAPRKAGQKRNSWTCPDCGFETVNRWARRHKAECKGEAR